MTIRGGLRSRYIADSVRVMILGALIQLDWFDSDRRHLPLTYAPRPVDWETEVAYNTFAITPEMDRNEETGLGGEQGGRTRFYVDFWGENDAIATHFSYDVRDILLGLHAGRKGPVCDVFDMGTLVDDTMAPSPLTRVDLERIRVDRPSGFPREWQRHWIVVSFWVEDEFLELSPTFSSTAVWTEAMWLAWRTLTADVDK